MPSILKTSDSPILKARDLRVRFNLAHHSFEAIRGVSFDVRRGEALGIVGESGSGKSQTMMAMLGLLAANGVASGEVWLEGRQILGIRERDLNTIRGNRMAVVFQDPMSSLNPYLRIEKQMTETLRLHKGMSIASARKRALEMLEAVKIPGARQRIRCYPHEFSGGMRQRVMIAMALLCEPAVLVADEPTTALDVTVQAPIIYLLDELRRDFNTAIILITHDMGVVAGLCERVLVMYGGRVIEKGQAEDLFYRSHHPYTAALLNAMPKVDEACGERLKAIPGSPPDLQHLPSGCPFAPRCEYVMARCLEEEPGLETVTGDHARACFYDGLGG